MVRTVFFSFCTGARKISSPSLQEAQYPKAFFRRETETSFTDFRDSRLQHLNEPVSLSKVYLWGSPTESQWNQLEVHIRALTMRCRMLTTTAGQKLQEDVKHSACSQTVTSSWPAI